MADHADTTRSGRRLPPCDVIGPAGERLVVHPRDVDDRADDLRRALGAPGERLVIGGHPVDSATPLTDSGLRRGSTITTERERPFGVDRSAAASCVPPVGPRDDVGESLPPAVADPRATGPRSPDGWEWAVVAGPACTAWRPLGPGRHQIGRAPSAALRVDDPEIEPHLGVVTTGDHVEFAQLTGRTPARVRDSGDGAVVEVGSTTVVVRRRRDDHGEPSPISTRPSATDPWRRVVIRRAAASAGPTEAPIAVPAPPEEHRAPPVSGLIGAAVAAAGAGLLAVVLGQAMFAAFAVVGAVGAVVTWLVGVAGAVRRRRRDRERHRHELAAVRLELGNRHRLAVERHRRCHPGLTDVLDAVERGDVWQRRLDTDQPLTVTVGQGAWRTPPGIVGTAPPELSSEIERASLLDDVAIPVQLAPGSATAVHGSRHAVDGMLRSIVVQLAAAHGPADWRLVVVTADPPTWKWATWLPQAQLDDRDAVLAVEETATLLDVATDDRTTVLVVDAPSTLDHRTGDVRRFAERTAATMIVGLDAGDTVPAVLEQTVQVGSTGTVALVGAAAPLVAGADVTGTAPQPVVDARSESASAFGVGVQAAIATGLAHDEAATAALALAPLVDPELVDATATLPVRVDLADVTDAGAMAVAAIADRWRRAGNDPAPVAVVGATADGAVVVDLARDGPHALVAGTTGSGKSELLRTLVVSLAMQSSPALLNVVLVDFKGGSTFDACLGLPHTVGVVTDLDEGLAARALTSLDAEVRRRERLLRASGADDLTSHRRVVEEPLARLVVIVDEFATLAKEHPDVLAALVSVAQRGRSLGIHLVLATQRPAGVVTDDIRANTDLRLALRLHDRAEATDIVGDAGPSTFPRALPGRAMLRLGPGELVTFQAASCTGPARPAKSELRVERPDDPIDVDSARSELEVAVDAIDAAATIAGAAATHRPWLDPLPPVLDAEDLSAWLVAPGAEPFDPVVPPPCPVAIGVIDDPAEQARRALRWDPTAGNLVLVGSLGGGVTSTLATLVRTTTAEWYVIDGAGDAQLAGLVDEPTCGGVVRLDEAERLQRLVRRLLDELDRRVAGAGGEHRQVAIAVDGFAALRSALGSVDGGESMEALTRLVRDGPALGIAWCIAGASPSLAPTIPAADRWVFRLDDPSAASAFGVRPLVDAVPGRLRIASNGLHAQVVDPSTLDALPATEATAALPRPEPIEVLPSMLDPDDLDRFCCRSAGDRRTVACGRSGQLRGRGRSACADVRSEPGAVELPIGVGADDLRIAAIRVAAGEHVLVTGGPASGVSTALDTIADAWSTAQPDGRIVRFAHGDDPAMLRALVGRCDRRGTVDPDDEPQLVGVFDEGEDSDTSATLVVIDDADRVDDPDGTIARLLARTSGGVTVVAGARLDRVRAAYGHWTREVARSRCGLVLTGGGDVDGDLFDIALPRRTIVAPRPGLAWVIDRTGHRLVQVAARMQR